jgi:hypothetical protein
VLPLRFAAIALVSGLAAACGAGGPPTPSTPTPALETARPTITDAPAPVESDPPSASPAAIATPSVPAALTPPPWISFPGESCCRGRDLEAGRYRLPGFLDLDLTIDVPAGWKVINEQRAMLFMLGRGENDLDNPSEILLMANATPVDGSVAATLAAITAADELRQLTTAAPSLLAGFEGLEQDLRARPNPGYEGDPDADIPAGVQFLAEVGRYLTPGFLWTTSTPEARLRVGAYLVREQVMLVYLEAPDSAFDGLVADARELLETLDEVAD